MSRYRQILIFLLAGQLFLCNLTLGQKSENSIQPLKILPFDLDDVFGKKIDNSVFIGKISIVSFIVRSTKNRATEIGQLAGADFGHLPHFQTIGFVNTSQLSFLARPFVNSIIVSTQKQSVKDAREIQIKRGTPHPVDKEISSKIILVEDSSAKVWKAFGLSADDENLYVGVVDKDGILIYFGKNPTYEEIKMHIH